MTVTRDWLIRSGLLTALLILTVLFLRQPFQFRENLLSLSFLKKTAQRSMGVPFTEVTRIRSISDRTKRMKAIFDALPPEKSWPRELGYGFKWSTDDWVKTLKISSYMSDAEAEIAFHKYVRHKSVICPHPVRLGTTGNGGWPVCLTPPYNLTPPCLVYSFGIGGDWSFDDHSVRIGCVDIAFDPTLGLPDHIRRGVRFNNMGLSGHNGLKEGKKWEVRTFDSLLKKFNHTETTIDILKIDIEHDEWPALEDMFLEGSLINVKQLAFEYHTDELRGYGGKTSRANEYEYYWMVIEALQKLGFKLWGHDFALAELRRSPHTKLVRDCCASLAFVNINLLV